MKNLFTKVKEKFNKIFGEAKYKKVEWDNNKRYEIPMIDIDCLININEIKTFLLAASLDGSFSRMVKTYDFINTEEDLDKYTRTFKILVGWEDETTTQPAEDEELACSEEKESRKEVAERMQNVVNSRRLAVKFVDVCRCRSIKEVAKLYEISETTARRVLKRIYDKYPELNYDD